jgi:Mg2+/Co2+ transporter CorB
MLISLSAYIKISEQAQMNALMTKIKKLEKQEQVGKTRRKLIQTQCQEIIKIRA